MSEILTAKALAERDGMATWHDWIRRLAASRHVRLVDRVCKHEVAAVVDHGRWIAHCECGGAEMVDPSEPIFFCFSCGNDADKNALRPVIFPLDFKRIDAALSARPVILRGGRSQTEQAILAQAVDLPREWQPGVAAGILEKENRAVGKEA